MVTWYPSLRSARTSICARCFLALGSASQSRSMNRTPSCKNLPNQAAKTMSNGPDGGLIAQSRQQTPEHALKVTAFLHDSGMRCLVRYSPQIFIALRRATAAVLLRTFLLTGTGSHPRRELRCRRKRTRLGPYFGDDLLRRIRSQTRHFCQSDYRVLMCLHGLRDHAVELGHLLIDQLQPL